MAIRIAIAGLGGAGQSNARRLREFGGWKQVAARRGQPYVQQAEGGGDKR